MPERDYALGHDARELRRLAAQSDYWGEETLELLTRAGLARGMRVLDLGSGGGDVSFLAARMVGETGSVLGVDRAAPAVEAATRRAAEMHLTNVRFQTAELDELRPEGRFDAVIGRLVLLYVPDPARVLANATRSLAPGGIVAFLEMDMDSGHTVPLVAAVQQLHDWMVEGFRRSGTKVDLGPQLWRVFRDAGLPHAQMFMRAKIEAAPALGGTRLLAETMRSLLPKMEATGVVKPGELEIDTLAERMQRALSDAGSTLIMPSLVGAWTRLPQ
jgi:ubiquinone/menaquinone biosynthesis C-methylase UbiE